MTSSLVGSEMCIRDRRREVQCAVGGRSLPYFNMLESWRPEHQMGDFMTCLLYTSDAADDM
eukprot:2804777-Prorocentrum_lima.AAC.1